MRSGLGAGARGKRRLRPSAGVCSAGRRALAVIGGVALLGCPQLLEDGFGKLPVQRDPPPEIREDGGVVHPEPNGAADTTPPTVTRSTPVDGARGVASTARVEFTFSEAMDTSATEAAYSSTDLPASSVKFSWRDRNSVLSIEPLQPLATASGTDPAQVNAQRYTVQLSARARDLAGNALAPLSVSFSVAREISQTLQASPDRSLTGNYRSDDTYGLYDCQESSTNICVGDGIYSGAITLAYRGFVTFDLSVLPSDRLALLAAELSLTVSLRYGDPFATLGALQLDMLSFGAIAMPAYGQASTAGLGVMATAAAAGDTLNADVLSAVQADAESRRTQFRLRFDTASDLDGTADVLIMDLSTARLRVTYSMP